MKNNILLFLVLISYSCFAQHKVVSDSRYGKHLEKTVIFKIKPVLKASFTANSISDPKIKFLFDAVSVTELYQKFPYSKAGKTGTKTIDISAIYEFTYAADIPLEKVLAGLLSNPNIEYAVPHHVVDPLYTPNDPMVASETHLNVIKAFQAWDICKGDTNTVIAISDWGTDNGHEDLMYNVKYNFNDPIDGIDNDDDGYTDNFRGWNFGENNNNPQAGTEKHGVYVSGISSAEGDNGKGVVGVGFKCRFVHLKIADADGNGIGGYEAIVYAADHGCSVINCSWGDSLDYNAYGQEIIDYAFSKNLLVVAAAGNNNTQRLFYPASYKHVLSVAALENNDAKATISTYGPYTGIGAPSRILTTNANNAYLGTGAYTSFASPVVAGCAAIVRSFYPNFNADQIREVLKVTSDKIDTVTGNALYTDLLGAGRVNLYRALTDTLPPSVVFHTYILDDHNDGFLSANDTVRISGLFTNYLSPSTNLNATISSSSSFIQVLGNTVNLGVMGTMDTVSNITSPFRIKIKSNTPYDTPVRLKIVFTDLVNGYRAVQYIEFIAKKSYLDIYPNNISTTITANGNIGFNYFTQLNGIGFRYKNSDPLIYDAGLMFGNSSSVVSSCVRQNNSFSLLSGTVQANPAIVSSEDYSASFNDNASATSLNVKVIQKTFAWHADSASNFIIIEYNLINNNQSPLSGMYAGIFADWDISFSWTNKANYNSVLDYSYNYSTMPDGIYTGMKLLTEQQKQHYAIDQTTDGSGGVNISQGFTTLQKFWVLTQNRHVAGGTGSGNDICDVVSAGPFTISAGDTVKVAFALMAGENLYVLQNAATEAQHKYDSIYHTIQVPLIATDKNLFNVFPNPVVDKLYVELMYENEKTECAVFDALGNTVYKFINTDKISIIDCSKWADGVYYLKASGINSCQVKCIVIAR